jgi:mRNA interferase RelE/StbE
MAYEIRLKPSVARALGRLPADIRSRVGARLDALAGTPRPPGCEKLSGADDLYRIRVGDYRVVYQLTDDIRQLLVVAIGHRRDVYRNL